MIRDNAEPATVPGALPQRDQLLLEVLGVIWGDAERRQPGSLTGHHQCSTLSNAMRGKLCARVASRPARRVRRGEHLYQAGSDASSVYLLRSGLVKTSVVSRLGRELTLRIYTPGEILGELCLCAGARQERATALESSEVIEISLDVLLAALQRDPNEALSFASSICERLSEAYDQLRSISDEPVLLRLVRTLLRLPAELGTTAAAGPQIGRHITQEELARIVGASREVVSGLLNRLRSSGLISYSPRGPITVEAARLRLFLEALEAGNAPMC
jgi:CRP/FNR family transcriptional regulator, cyclic AMP receptor protein